ncbi:hypothetical protein C6Q14_09810 [Burkholderia ambifaria]|nr:hypothetical protein C6Q14_09810 [Burkholderia ambifaria]
MRDVGAVEGGQGHVHSLKTGRSARAPYGVRMLTCSRCSRRVDLQRRALRRETEALRHAPLGPVPTTDRRAMNKAGVGRL